MDFREDKTYKGWVDVALSYCARRKRGVYFSQCNPRKDEWKAWLIVKTASGEPSLVSRLEYHGSHPGLHAHADCDRGGLEEGPASIEVRTRIPPAGQPHRRVNVWRKNTFWEQARRHFRIEHPKGTLL